MASPLTLTWEINIERVEDNEPSRGSCLKHTSWPEWSCITNSKKKLKREEDRQRKSRVALLFTRPTNKHLRVYPVRYRQGWIQSWAMGRASDLFYCFFSCEKFLRTIPCYREYYFLRKHDPVAPWIGVVDTGICEKKTRKIVSPSHLCTIFHWNWSLWTRKFDDLKLFVMVP